mgnify:CR=1 FL=1
MSCLKHLREVNLHDLQHPDGLVHRHIAFLAVATDNIMKLPAQLF